jgi:C1A family cysteine protease
MAKYNLKKDSIDERDFIKVERLSSEKLPDTYFKDYSSVFDQGEVGSCTAQSTMSMLARHLGFVGSRLFQYYNCREMDGTLQEDAGSTLRQSMKALNRYGLAHEMGWGYIQKNWAKKPPVEFYNLASGYISKFEYKRLPQSVPYLKTCLAQNCPFVFGFTVYENFDKHDFKKNATMPKPQGKAIGGHAVTCVGYDETKQVFIIRNSWGSKWGNNGYFYMPYEIIAEHTLCWDFWTITNVLKNDGTNTNNIERNEPKHCKLADLFGRFKDRIAAMLYH